MKLIVGLGNPGRAYERTRHNFGFLVIKALADNFHLKWRNSRLCHGFLSVGEIAGQKSCLLLPMTFMNHSGLAVGACVKKKGVVLDNLLVVCDDFHLEFGQLRIRPTGGDGGHNGLNDVIRSLGTRNFGRLRIGIGSPPEPQEAADFVLAEFQAREKKQLDDVVQNAVKCCVIWLREGIGEAMNVFNRASG